MRLRVAIVCSALAFSLPTVFSAAPLRAQYQPPSDRLQITARSAATWSAGGEDVIQLDGPVTIETDRARLSAQRAVLWLRPSTNPAAPAGTRRTDIILVGDAEVAHNGALRTGARLAVTAEVAGEVQITAQDRRAADLSGTPEFVEAAALRRQALPGPDTRPATAPAIGRAEAAVEPAPPPSAKIEPVRFIAPGNIEIDTNYAVDNKVTAVITGGVTLMQRKQETGEIIELQADRAVVFTTLDSLRDADKLSGTKSIEEAVTGVYLEGDVRVVQTPGPPKRGQPAPTEQRFRARRLFYDFTTDRAILTDAVVHTTEPELQIPIVMRAKTVRQLSKGEYKAKGVELSTSTFALPSYSIAADSIYVRTIPGDGGPERVVFDGEDTKFKIFGVPVFWLPAAGGEVAEQPVPLRGGSFVHTSRLGTGVRTDWGLLETLGRPSPKEFDASYKLDYFSERGPAFGLDANYDGGFVTETSKQRWAFSGDLQSYFVYDHGIDEFGRLPTRVGEDPSLRGQALFRHQHFFPGDWQAQVRLGYVSDPTFMEEWFRREFNQGEERDVSFYLKHQTGTEAATFLVDVQPNNLVTTADMLQEQFEVERLPEFGYHRIGDGVEFGKGQFPTSGMTLISNNTVSGLRFNRTGATLTEQGFTEDGSLNPGIPSLGQTGVQDDTTYRGDFRQEVDFPFSLGQFRFMPYVVGRYTAYSDSPGGGDKQRLFGAVGARVSTSFWKVDDSVESRMFDLHRMRHVIEPELNLFTSGTTVDRQQLFLYDEPIDAIHDVSAVSLALRQRWQTERGAPGRRRSVDFFTLNTEVTFYSNEPEATLPPQDFRGLYFASTPEASQPRDAVNVDGSWRLADTTVLLADAQYNIEEKRLATTGAGLIVQRDARMTYFLSARRIEALDSSILGLAGYYELSPKYTITVTQSYDFGQSENIVSALEVRRRFDTFFLSFAYSYSLVDQESGFAINLYPTWLPFRGLDQTAFNSVLHGARARH